MRVLVIDDDGFWRDFISSRLIDFGLDVVSAVTTVSALQSSGRYDAVVCDWDLGATYADKVFEELFEAGAINEATTLVVVSGSHNAQSNFTRHILRKSQDVFVGIAEAIGHSGKGVALSPRPI